MCVSWLEGSSGGGLFFQSCEYESKLVDHAIFDGLPVWQVALAIYLKWITTTDYCFYRVCAPREMFWPHRAPLTAGAAFTTTPSILEIMVFPVVKALFQYIAQVLVFLLLPNDLTGQY